jgi:hypothetical protein
VQESGTAEIEGTPLATLRKQGKLDAYSGAEIDANYNFATDGNQKWKSIVDQLRNG